MVANIIQFIWISLFNSFDCLTLNFTVVSHCQACPNLVVVVTLHACVTVTQTEFWNNSLQTHNHIAIQTDSHNKNNRRNPSGQQHLVYYFLRPHGRSPYCQNMRQITQVFCVTATWVLLSQCHSINDEKAEIINMITTIIDQVVMF